MMIELEPSSTEKNETELNIIIITKNSEKINVFILRYLHDLQDLWS